MRGNRAFAAILRDDRDPLPTVLLELKRTLFITRQQTCLVWDDPNLQEVHGLGLRCVVLAVADACSRAHPLHVIDVNDSEMAEPHMLWVVIVAEGKRMTAVEPAQFCMSSSITATEFDHIGLLT